MSRVTRMTRLRQYSYTPEVAASRSVQRTCRVALRLCLLWHDADNTHRLTVRCIIRIF